MRFPTMYDTWTVDEWQRELWFYQAVLGVGVIVIYPGVGWELGRRKGCRQRGVRGCVRVGERVRQLRLQLGRGNS